MRWRPLAELNRDVAPSAPDDFEHAVMPHIPAAYNVARWLVSDATLAEDVVQDSVVRALRYFASYKGGDSRAWLLRIVRNVAYTALAARRRAPTTSLDHAGPAQDEEPQIPDPADNPEQSLLRGKSFAKLDQALAALPPDLRECLVLHELEDLSYKDIAEITGVPIGTVMSQLWRARQALMRGQDQGAKP